MAEKKVKKESLIGLELANFEKKILEYQQYLVAFDVRYIDDDKKRHEEITAQIKIMDSLPPWLAALEKLRIKDIEEKKAINTRGDHEMSGLMDIKINQT